MEKVFGETTLGRGGRESRRVTAVVLLGPSWSYRRVDSYACDAHTRFVAFAAAFTFLSLIGCLSLKGLMWRIPGFWDWFQADYTGRNAVLIVYLSPSAPANEAATIHCRGPTGRSTVIWQ